MQWRRETREAGRGLGGEAVGRVWRGDKTVTVRWKGGDTAGNVEMASAGRGGCSGRGGRSLGCAGAELAARAVMGDRSWKQVGFTSTTVQISVPVACAGVIFEGIFH